MILIKINFIVILTCDIYLRQIYIKTKKVELSENFDQTGSPDEIPVLKKQSRKGGSRYQKLDIQSRLGSPTREVDKEDFLPKSKKEERRVEPVILVPITTDSSILVILYYNVI